MLARAFNAIGRKCVFDVIIRDGMVVDGTGSPARRVDIGVERDTITALDNLQGAQAAETIVAQSLHVCPGFIDIHAHSDFNILVAPPGRSKVLQGVTTEVCGNCGMSAAPLIGATRKQREASLAHLGITLTWTSLQEFSERVARQGLLCNIVPLIGHGNIRGAVIGYDNRHPTADEFAQMRALLEQELGAGGWGMSSGLIYPPGRYASCEELIELCRTAARYHRLYTTHLRSEGDRLLEAVTEAIAIGKQAGIPVQISHLKTLGKQNWHKLPEVFSLIEKAREEGLRLTADRYPYTAASTDLDAVLPAWVCEGGNAAELARLKKPGVRAQLVCELRQTERGFAEEILIARVASEKNKALEGRLLSDIAERRKQSPVDTLLDLLIEEELRVDAIFFSMSEDNLREILKKDYVMIGSDASVWDATGPLSSGKPHPRGFGTFPRVLGKYVRDEQILELEEAVRKMTGLPAETFGIADRGVIRKGCKADLVLFNLAEIKDTATYEQPHQFPSGIVRVMVNGQWVVKDSNLTGTLPGKLLLRQTE